MNRKENSIGSVIPVRNEVNAAESSKVDEAALKATGARGVIIRGNGVQVIYGPHVTIIKNEVEEILS